MLVGRRTVGGVGDYYYPSPSACLERPSLPVPRCRAAAATAPARGHKKTQRGRLMDGPEFGFVRVLPDLRGRMVGPEPSLSSPQSQKAVISFILCQDSSSLPAQKSTLMFDQRCPVGGTVEPLFPAPQDPGTRFLLPPPQN